ncbi:hypothetical protein [Tunicatimonas pelagia]|uniref:hypothetical protein n=1 Tax=Tunicatimonas pelagia TaxID=931531 RepID=UPI002665FEB8|nr:hypothetical protein [Tunicatimonas pelagia]WKN46514.1 hypothetical protein P0M28_30940 [Tunicatimonas pelagia]
MKTLLFIVVIFGSCLGTALAQTNASFSKRLGKYIALGSAYQPFEYYRRGGSSSLFFSLYKPRPDLQLSLGGTYSFTPNFAAYIEVNTRMEYYELQNNVVNGYQKSNYKHVQREWLFFPGACFGLQLGLGRFFVKGGIGLNSIRSRKPNGRESVHEGGGQWGEGQRVYDRSWWYDKYVVGSGFYIYNSLDRFYQNAELGFRISDKVSCSLTYMRGGKRVTKIYYESIFTWLRDMTNSYDDARLRYSSNRYGVKITVNI